MKLLGLFFWLMCAGTLEALLPNWAFMGHAGWPLLLGLVLYYALHHSRALMFTAALAAGLLEDSLSLAPLGYSAACFCLAGGLAAHFREEVFDQLGLTHVLFGAVAAAGVSSAMYVLLTFSGQVRLPWTWGLERALGSLVLGALATPIVFRALARLDRVLGILEEEAA